MANAPTCKSDAAAANEGPCSGPSLEEVIKAMRLKFERKDEPQPPYECEEHQQQQCLPEASDVTHHLTKQEHQETTGDRVCGLRFNVDYLLLESGSAQVLPDFTGLAEECGDDTITLPATLTAIVLAMREAMGKELQENGVCFLDLIHGRPGSVPTVPNPLCGTCNHVYFFLRAAKTYEEAAERASKLHSLMLFEVLRELLSRFSSPLCIIPTHLVKSRTEEKIVSEAICDKRQKELAFRTFVDIMHEEYKKEMKALEGANANLLRFFLVQSILIWRDYVAQKFPIEGNDPCDELFFYRVFNCTDKLPELRKSLERFCKSLVVALARSDADRFPMACSVHESFAMDAKFNDLTSWMKDVILLNRTDVFEVKVATEEC